MLALPSFLRFLRLARSPSQPCAHPSAGNGRHLHRGCRDFRLFCRARFALLVKPDLGRRHPVANVHCNALGAARCVTQQRGGASAAYMTLRLMNIKKEASIGTEPSPPSRLYARSMWPVKYMATSVTTAPAALSWTGGQGMMKQDVTIMQWGMTRQEEGRRGEEEKGVRR